LVPPKGAKDGWYQQPAQYLRTFSLSEPPRDLSISQEVLHNVDLVRAGGLLYYENQYFRDPYLGDALVKLYEERDNGLTELMPYIVIVTNRQTNDRGQLVNAEGIAAAKPTKMMYEQLRACAGANNILWCWLHVTKRDALDPDSPREAHPGEYLLNMILRYRRDGGDEALARLNGKLTRWRNLIWFHLKSETAALAGKGSAVVNGAMASFAQWLSAMGVDINLWLSDVLLDTRQFVIARVLEVAGPAYDASQNIPSLPGGQGSGAPASGGGDETNPWGWLVQRVEMIPNPPNFLMAQVPPGDPSAEIAAWYAANKPTTSEEDRRKAEIARLEDHSPIVDALRKQSSNAREYDHTLFQRTWNTLLLWKHKRLQEKADANPRPVKGAIYVHSKVIVVDEVLAMIGSNNINERSMWHDSENAVMFRATERESLPAELRSQLFEIMVGQSMKGITPDKIFNLFKKRAADNAKILEQGGLEGHVVPYIPDEVAAGSSVLS